MFKIKVNGELFATCVDYAICSNLFLSLCQREKNVVLYRSNGSVDFEICSSDKLPYSHGD